MLYLTRFLYSAYPSSPFSNTASSFLMRMAMRGTYSSIMANEMGEASTSGMVRNSGVVAEYMGCLTIPYSPVSMTF